VVVDRDPTSNESFETLETFMPPVKLFFCIVMKCTVLGKESAITHAQAGILGMVRGPKPPWETTRADDRAPGKRPVPQPQLFGQIHHNTTYICSRNLYQIFSVDGNALVTS